MKRHERRLGGRRRLARVANTPAGADEPQPLGSLGYQVPLLRYPECPPLRVPKKHITALLMRLIYVPHERLIAMYADQFFSLLMLIVAGSGTRRRKRAVLLAQASRGSSLRARRRTEALGC